MRVKSEDAKYLGIPSSFSITKDDARDLVAKEVSALDNFHANKAQCTSPFSMRKQFKVDPFVEIADDAQNISHKPWWNDGLVAQLPSIPASRLEQGPLAADLIQALRDAAKDKSYLTVNWRDDT